MTTQQVTISIENLAPENGTLVTPLWFGFHDGTFDTYDRGRPVSPGLESLAEDGATELISTEFDLAGFGSVQGTILGTEGTPGPIDPGEVATFTVELDLDDPQSAFFNYAAMIIPSNDFFIANGNERLHPILDENGNFIGADFIVAGSNILDAGSEVNDEIPENTAFFGQQTPNTGEDENGVVQVANGFIPDGNILSSPDFINADFTVPGYEVARIRVFIEDEVNDPVSLAATLTGDQEVPEPTGSSATGLSSFTLNAAGDALEYDLTVSGLDFWQLLGTEPTTPDTGDDVTRIHIHDNVRGENGPVAFGLFDLVAPEAGDQDIDDLSVVENADGSVTLSGIWEETDPALIPLSNFVDEIRDAEPGEDIGLYWNIHTEQFPGGEIRGQLIGDQPDIPEVSVFAEPDTPLIEAEATPGTFIFQLSEPAPEGGLVVNFTAGDDDPEPNSPDVNIGGEGTTNIEDFTIRAIPDFISSVTLPAGTTEARLVVTPFLDGMIEGLETITVDLLPGEGYTVDADNILAELSILDSDGELNGDDVIVGTAADETLAGGNGNDTVAGGLGDDLITGNNGNDLLRGDLNSRSSGGSNGGDDTLLGGAGDDRIGGKGGNDQLFGEAGNDSLWGDGGDDELDGGLGDDQLFGGEGADQFVLAVGNGTDVIGDFEVGVDRFAIAQLSFEQLELTQEGSAVQISLVETEEVLAVVSGVEVGDLTADSFV